MNRLTSLSPLLLSLPLALFLPSCSGEDSAGRAMNAGVENAMSASQRRSKNKSWKRSKRGKNSIASSLVRPEIPYEKFTLPNGLRVIVHTDRKAPVIAVNVWYHVGGKDEPVGRSGFAHLFEHLMFNGTENYPGDYFEPFQKIGATGMNGTTNSDRTNYFENVPTHALDIALWMESDRMGHFLGALGQGVLDEQRGVVQNEKRQGENQPYGKVFITASKGTFPSDHPYSRSVIGSMEDLDAAALEDVKDWFRDYYGPNNAVIVLAGDIDLETARERMTHYFGDIQPGPTHIRSKKWIAKRSGQKREVIYDKVPVTRIYKVWNVPEIGSSEFPAFELLSSYLADGENSVLQHRLLRKDQSATSVFSFYYDREIAGQFWIGADVKEGVDPGLVEQAIDEELALLVEEGLDSDLLEAYRTDFLGSMIRGLERIGGFGGKSDLLARGEIYMGDPDALYRQLFDGVRDADAKSLQRLVKEWLSDGDYVLQVIPDKTDLVAAGEGADRSALPEPGSPPQAELPALRKGKLDNGLAVWVMERHTTPVVSMSLELDAGFRNDGAKPGISSLAMDMLLKGGTEKHDTLALEKRILRLGASMNSSSSLDSASIGMSTLKQTLPESMDLLAEVALQPAFDEDELELLRPTVQAAIKQEKARPFSQALRVLPPLLYGEDHPYGNPLTGTGAEEVVSTLTAADLREFYMSRLAPGEATLIAVGDVTLEEVMAVAEASFGNWEQPPSDMMESPGLPEVRQANSGRIFLVDKPDASQSLIIGGQLFPSASSEDDLATDMAVQVIGGSFVSRLNMNLREDKHWSYGARSFILRSLGQQMFLAYAPVQSDKTIESIKEIQREFAEYLGYRPATNKEFDELISKKTLEMPGRYETIGSLRSSLAEVLRLDRADNYLHAYSKHLNQLSLKDVRDAAQRRMTPENWVWVVVGDRKDLEPKLRDLELGPVEVL